jgi:hypothetical protein
METKPAVRPAGSMLGYPGKDVPSNVARSVHKFNSLVSS